MASNGSTELNQETGTKRHLRPLDAFPGPLVRPKCICGRGNRAGGAYSAPPDPLACCPLSKNLFPALGLRHGISRCPQDKFLATPMGSASNQNYCKVFHLKEKVEKTPNYYYNYYYHHHYHYYYHYYSTAPLRSF